MEENKYKIRWTIFLPEIGFLILIAIGICGYEYIRAGGMENGLRNVVMSILGVLITGFLLRRDYVCGNLDYDNANHLWRFWVAFFSGIVIAFVCVFLPTGAWPFLPVYVLLCLFSNMSVGVLSASVLLMVSVLLCGADVGIFFLYFISGIFAVSLFRHLKSGFTIGMPWFLSMLCLLVCETANIVLTTNEQLELELFFIPIANMVISSILFVAIMHLFSGKVVYRYRENFLELNDPENAILAEYKKENRDDYFLCVHTAYFCERIATRLGLDSDAVKCAGYYHKMEKNLPQFLEDNHFPPAVRDILREYHTHKDSVIHKETAVLVCSDAIIHSMMCVFAQNHSSNGEKMLNYDQVIDIIFKKFHDAGTFKECDITMQELNTMHKIFKEEKLYYDFLR